MKKALILGITGSFFFAFTFVLNRSMNLGGGYWLWSAVLRYLFTLPMMAPLLLRSGQLGQVLRTIQAAPGPWLLWSSVGFGMTLCSMPFWLILGAVELICHGAPGGSQMLQSLCVALFSGVIATILFFRATDLVKHDQRKLAVIEATQSGEVIFTLLLGVVFLHDAMPSPLALLGIALIVAGMIANSLAVSQ